MPTIRFKLEVEMDVKDDISTTAYDVAIGLQKQLQKDGYAKVEILQDE